MTIFLERYETWNISYVKKCLHLKKMQSISPLKNHNQAGHEIMPTYTHKYQSYLKCCKDSFQQFVKKLSVIIASEVTSNQGICVCLRSWHHWKDTISNCAYSMSNSKTSMLQKINNSDYNLSTSWKEPL